jgi:hypothetical protein
MIHFKSDKKSEDLALITGIKGREKNQQTNEE